MKTTITFAVALLAAAVSTGAVAANGPAGSGPNPYVDCGIGAALFPNTHWAAVTSNVTWDVGTTAIISATASPETCSGKNVKAAAFILDTYETLAEETARGKGEHLVSLMNIMEVEDEKRTALVSQVRAGMAVTVSGEDYDNMNRLDKAKSYYALMMTAVNS
ncbi:DUF3015 family protein [Porticoccaceae bacterium LTM1]|nr:DUF3015 family protein [Porticoccaceae bacterium LTM1]